LERPLLGYLFAYALVIGLLSLIVPLTVQELVNTFAYAIQPIMIITLAGIMVVILLAVGGFRAMQLLAVEMIEQRVFARIALGLTRRLPDMRLEGFKPKLANYFMETVLLQRALSTLLIDIVNVVVGGLAGMSILVFYHPLFLLFNVALLVGSPSSSPFSVMADSTPPSPCRTQSMKR
jgi:ABC-type bacteriocin/lantibiotic exporter with double-glycine peptidase domain